MEENFQYISASITDKGLSEKRPQNEDSYLELTQSGLFAVADGVGGAQAGEVASSMAMEILGEAFVNMQNNGDAEEVMKAGIEKGNSAIFQMSNDLPSLATMATTIVAVHLAGNIATIGHVGDSRLYRLDGNGNLYRETQDHSIVEEEVRAGRMTAAQALNHPSRNVISRALGAESTVEIDLKTIMFEPNTTFLLCSDGITRHIEDFEIRELLNSSLHPNEICLQMKNICYTRGAEDNLTAVIVRVSSELASNYSDENQGTATDFEEQTVASARPAAANQTAFSETEDKIETTDYYDEAPTQDLKLPASLQTESSQIDSVQELTPIQETVHEPTVNFVESTLPKEEEQIQSPVSVQSKYDSEYETQPETSSGFFGKLIGALLFLLIGIAVGAGGYYLFSSTQQPPVQTQPITEMKTQNIPFSGFEENRRNVDKNPQEYLTKTASSPPQDAEDFYLIGRAFLLSGKYQEAKQSFNEAKNRLGQTADVNSKILATEIAMSLAIINDPLAIKAFEKDIQADTSSGNSTEKSNSNR
ncbi:MAG TPA: protein phosphatase 2C domain-containing protein [Pyrinomonadaceae bacterium]|nr:protein phosphatase 2C domain-containing protein [Pyrinomonadaceae bacterium]